MISDILNILEKSAKNTHSILERGAETMRSNSRLLLVAVLLFVFPLLFVWITQGFFITAYDNINTSEKHRVGIIHDSISTIIKTLPEYGPTLNVLINKYVSENPDISKIRIVDKDENGFIIISATDDTLIGTYEKSDQAYRSLPLSASGEAFIVETVISEVRAWQVFSGVELADNQLYIFSEHKFDLIDSVMAARKQQSYLGLTAIFIFLIVLAYWLNRQVSWEKSSNQLAEQLKERDLFSNMIAHEFRSPLTAIKGYASFLQESENLSKEEFRFASNIRNSAERLVILVGDFLEVARLQAGKLKIDKADVDIRNVLISVSEDLKVMAEDKGLRLKYVPDKKPVIMNTDKARLMQVFTNIISNAIKYTDSGVVELECIGTPREVTILVKDSGMGISADDQQKLFTPFSRVGDVDNTQITGTGLGMWITKQLVALLDGTIGVESIKGVGTHIVITFKV